MKAAQTALAPVWSVPLYQPVAITARRKGTDRGGNADITQFRGTIRNLPCQCTHRDALGVGIEWLSRQDQSSPVRHSVWNVPFSSTRS